MDWGSTVCQMPKVAHLNMSYEELFNSTEEMHVEYVKWVWDHGRNSGGRLEDFRNYLVAVKYQVPKTLAKDLVPGTKDARVRKK